MSDKMYTPTPVETDDVVLNPDIMALAELLAKNTHDIWAMNRIADGWVYGPARDDVKKETPCLVPYEALPDSEKKYDRDVSLETLRLIIKLGYRIVREN
ncbi:MAG: Ryanodine receptor Ryr [Clostridia bacterium]|nr:Ryanodine receptor Ryr [Clostridia bacterium]